MDIFDVFVDMQATGDRIRQLRKEKKYKVFDLAKALGLESEQAIYKWQRGQCLPNADNLVRLSILFGCHIDDILMHSVTIEEDESPLLPLYRVQDSGNQLFMDYNQTSPKGSCLILRVPRYSQNVDRRTFCYAKMLMNGHFGENVIVGHRL